MRTWIIAIICSGISLQGVLAKEEGCLERCVRNHAQWGYPACQQISEYLIEGPKCYEVYSECLESCKPSGNKPLVDKFIKPSRQVKDQWRQGKLCSTEVQKLPLTILPGEMLIDPRWAGYCECFNGRLIQGECGHQRLTCREVCSGQNRF